jgi:hypothetical protein
MSSALTISKQVYLPNLNAGLTYDIDTYAAFAYTIGEVFQIQTSSGTVTAAIKINGTNVTGLSGISVSSTPQNVTASGANSVSAGDHVQIVFSSNSGATNINFTLEATRTAVSTVSNSDGTLIISPTAGDAVASLSQAGLQAFLPGGFVNKFRNGQMGVSQRGTPGTIVAGTPAYCLDGFIINATGANVIWAQGNDFPTSTGTEISNWLEIVGATGNTDVSIKQRIESSIASNLSSQQVTFQCQIINQTGGTITPTLTVKHAGSADNWTSPVTDVNAVSLQSVANGATASLSYTFAAAAASYYGLEVTVDFGALNSGSKNVITTGWDIRVTPGVATGLNSTPPVFEQRPISTELAFCQRYFNSTFGNGVIPAQNAGLSGALAAQCYGATAGELYTYWQFPVQMRANPTITTYNPSVANANWRDKTGSSDVVVSVDPDSAIGLAGVMIGSQTTALTAGHRCYIHATASAEL